MEIYDPNSLGDKKKQCPMCGSFMDSLARRCPKCGIPMDIRKVQEAVSTPKVKKKTNNGPTVWAYLALIFGLLGGVLGLIFGFIGLGKDDSKENKLLCRIGIGLSIIWLIVYIVLIVLYFTTYAPISY